MKLVAMSSFVSFLRALAIVHGTSRGVRPAPSSGQRSLSPLIDLRALYPLIALLPLLIDSRPRSTKRWKMIPGLGSFPIGRSLQFVSLSISSIGRNATESAASRLLNIFSAVAPRLDSLEPVVIDCVVTSSVQNTDTYLFHPVFGICTFSSVASVFE